MKILHITKEHTPSGSAETIIQDQTAATDNEVTVFNLNQDKDYAKLVELIMSSDKVFTW